MQGDRHYDYDAFGNLIRERRGRDQLLSPNTATTASTA
jgi:YD repeat-containing protein